MLAMPGSRSYNKSVAPFQSVCLLFCHKHNIFHFFSLTPRGVASHLIQPLPASLLLNQPKCLKQMLNYQLEGKARKLREEGPRGKRPNRSKSLANEEEETLWKSGQLGSGNPRALINTMWWLLTQHFGLRGRQEHHNMKVEDFFCSGTTMEMNTLLSPKFLQKRGKEGYRSKPDWLHRRCLPQAMRKDAL